VEDKIQSKNFQQEKKVKDEDIKALKNKLKKSGTEIKHLKADLTELKAEYLRQLADKENLRKRLERDKREFYQHSLSEVFLEMLSILDNFERALKSDAQNSDKSLRDGVELIYKQFLSLLEKRGVKPIDIEEKKFDPRFHQAFATAQSPDVLEAQIDEEYQKGYTLHDRLLRPTLVKVLVPAKEEE
jgi:molecular chaperone GrpE